MSEEVKPELALSPEEEAKKVLLEALRKREEACAEEVNSVLAKHGFSLKFQVNPTLVEVKK